METVVNNPERQSSGSVLNMIVGIILLLVVAFLFFYYALPLMRQSATPQVNVPERVDVNVNQPAQ